MSKELSRRKFLRTGVTAGTLAGVGSLGLISSQRNQMKTTNYHSWPFPYVKLDTERVMVLAHDSFFVGGCAYGAFHGILKALEEKIGDPYTNFPTQMMKFGKGGGMDWGTICGTLNGSAAAINLVCKNWGALIHELNGWYTEQAFPSDKSNQMAVSRQFKTIKYDGELDQSVSGSPLCHASVTNWCNRTGFTATSLPRKERCGRVTADVAAKAVEMLNQDLEGKFVPVFEPTNESETCLSCHGPDSAITNVISDMNCTQCHGIPHASSKKSSK